MNHTTKKEFFTVKKEYPNNGEEESEVRETIIQEVEVPQLSEYIDRINQLLGTDIESPFPHITLYS